MNTIVTIHIASLGGRRAVPRATCDLEKLIVLPTMSAISGCE